MYCIGNLSKVKISWLILIIKAPAAIHVVETFCQQWLIRVFASIYFDYPVVERFAERLLSVFDKVPIFGKVRVDVRSLFRAARDVNCKF